MLEDDEAARRRGPEEEVQSWMCHAEWWGSGKIFSYGEGGGDLEDQGKGGGLTEMRVVLFLCWEVKDVGMRFQEGYERVVEENGLGSFFFLRSEKDFKSDIFLFFFWK